MGEEKIFLGSDHSGFYLKENIKSYLAFLGVPFIDMGSIELQPNDDYPDYASLVAGEVAKYGGCGIVCSDSGMSMCVAANKTPSIRAVHAISSDMAKWAREELDANVLCLSQEYTNPEIARDIIRTWLETEYLNEERFARRLEKIGILEKGELSVKKNVAKTISIKTLAE